MDTVKRNINIQNYLPHREPMLMVDTILEICREKVVTVFEIREENIFLDGDQFVAAGLVEHIAQTCSTITGQDLRSELDLDQDPGSQVIGFITQIKKVKVQNLPKVGDIVKSEATLVSRFGEICTVKCETFTDEKHIAEAEISLFIKAL